VGGLAGGVGRSGAVARADARAQGSVTQALRPLRPRRGAGGAVSRRGDRLWRGRLGLRRDHPRPRRLRPPARQTHRDVALGGAAVRLRLASGVR
jgi:hypothetical protein